MFRYRIDHPYRPTNWRWERARILKEYGSITPGRYKDDKWVKVATSFRSAKDKCKDELSLYTLFDKYPDIAMAYELWDEDVINTGNRAHPMRFEIEARILAQEPLDLIARKCQLNTEVIVWYERLFFNVLDRIQNKPYIFHQAIGDKIHGGMSDRDYGIIWKLYGYVRGSAMLDFLITTFSDWSKIDSDKVEISLVDDYRVTMKRKSALASRMLGLNGRTQDRLIELQTKIVEVEKAVGDAAPDAIQQNIQVMLQHLPLIVGQQSTTRNDDNQLIDHLKRSSDLRANELVDLSLGKPIDPKLVEEYKFPEPLNNGQEVDEGS